MRKILAELIDTKSISFFLCKSKSDGDAKKFCFCFWSAEDSSKARTNQTTSYNSTTSTILLRKPGIVVF